VLDPPLFTSGGAEIMQPKPSPSLNRVFSALINSSKTGGPFFFFPTSALSYPGDVIISTVFRPFLPHFTGLYFPSGGVKKILNELLIDYEEFAYSHWFGQ